MVPKARSSAVTIKTVMIGRDSDGHAYTLEEFREFFGPEDYLWYWNHKAVPVVPLADVSVVNVPVESVASVRNTMTT